MKIERLMAITTILLNKGTVTAKELAERFEVSPRTIYRDVEALSGAGVPVYAAQGNGGGISMMEGYSMDRMMLSKQESESLLLALQTLQAVKYPDVDLILDKLGALFHNASAANWVEVDFSPWGSGPEQQHYFQMIRRAILEQRVLEFKYSGADGLQSERKVEPLTLIFKAKAWYLRAWCRAKAGFRTFRLSRIRNMILTDCRFERKDVATGRNSEDTPAEPKAWVNLKLRFAPRVAYRIYDDYDERMIRRNEDGTLELHTCFPEDEWVYGYLLSFGPDLEVLEPDHIRRILRERLKAVLKYYDTDLLVRKE